MLRECEAHQVTLHQAVPASWRAATPLTIKLQMCCRENVSPLCWRKVWTPIGLLWRPQSTDGSSNRSFSLVRHQPPTTKAPWVSQQGRTAAALWSNKVIECLAITSGREGSHRTDYQRTNAQEHEHHPEASKVRGKGGIDMGKGRGRHVSTAIQVNCCLLSWWLVSSSEVRRMDNRLSW